RDHGAGRKKPPTVRDRDLFQPNGRWFLVQGSVHALPTRTATVRRGPGWCPSGSGPRSPPAHCPARRPGRRRAPVSSLSRDVGTTAQSLCQRPEEAAHPRVDSTLSPGPSALSVVDHTAKGGGMDTIRHYSMLIGGDWV